MIRRMIAIDEEKCNIAPITTPEKDLKAIGG
jgi:hypothetical protein